MSVNVEVEIRRVEDDETRAHTHDSDDAEVEFLLWTDGNYACDCNRELFFERAGGEERMKHTACGDDRYLVRVKIDDEVVLDEFKDGRWQP